MSSTIKEEPLVSIIIPAYNSEKTIQACIASVLDQDYAELEVLVVNDGSTDKTEERVLSCPNETGRIKYFRIDNHGPGYARNYGLERSRGDFVGFIDSDDYIHPGMISGLLDCIQLENASIAMCQVDMGISEEGAGRGNEIESITGYTAAKRMLENPASDGYSFAFAKLYRRSSFGEYKLCFPCISFAEDVILNISAYLNCNKVVVINKCYYCYQQQPYSLTNRYDPERAAKYCYAIDCLEREIKKYGYWESLRESFSTYVFHAMLNVASEEMSFGLSLVNKNNKIKHNPLMKKYRLSIRWAKTVWLSERLKKHSIIYGQTWILLVLYCAARFRRLANDT